MREPPPERFHREIFRAALRAAGEMKLGGWVVLKNTDRGGMRTQRHAPPHATRVYGNGGETANAARNSKRRTEHFAPKYI